MFAELLKQTPVCDCPDSHMEIEKVLSRMRETTAEINKATDDPRMRITMEKTWILQDRLLLSDQVCMKLHIHGLLVYPRVDNSIRSMLVQRIPYVL